MKRRIESRTGQWHRAMLAVAVWLVGLLPLAEWRPAHAQTASLDPLNVQSTPNGVQIEWQSPGGRSVADLQSMLPLERYQGYDLPFKVIALRAPAPEWLPGLEAAQVEAVDLPAGAVLPGAPDAPPLLEWDGAPELAAAPAPALPARPLFVLRSGSMDGAPIVVLALSPIYSDGGRLRLATRIRASLPGAALIDGDTMTQAAIQDAASSAAEIDALHGLADAALNPDASTARFRLRVANLGIQSVSLSALRAFDSSIGAGDLNRARVTFRGSLVPVQRDGGSFRFFASTPGDRWNVTDAYYLSFDSANPSPNMGSRSVAALGGSGAPSTVIERGQWEHNRNYESLYAGVDGDHWFAADLRSRPLDPPAANARNTLNATLWNSTDVNPFGRLPLVGGGTTITVTFAPFEADPGLSQPVYPLRASSGGVTLREESVGVLDPSDPAHSRWLANKSWRFTVAAAPVEMSITLLPASYAAGLKAEKITFARPVRLDLGGQGALFSGAAAQTQYRWANPPELPATRLYDITNRAAPHALTGASASGYADGQPGRSYLLAGAGFLHTPAIEPYTPVVFPTAAAQALYIIPDSSYAAALQPLVSLRHQQGLSVAVVDVRTIYDLYSYGQVSPTAIRTFLQKVWATWNPRPLAAVMVGDGTYDVKNYGGHLLTPRLIPPYMQENADPYVGEAPCDNCYGQINGANANTGDDPAGRFFDTEFWIGRFPVKSVHELAAVVAKIVQYESTSASNPLWRSRTLYFADNYWKPQVNGPPRRDTGGDFALYSDQMRALNPSSHSEGMAARAYYDPYPELHVPTAVGQAWRVPNPNEIGPRVLDEMNDGVALSVYNGHANYFRMGATEANLPNRDAILIPGDELLLNNGNRLFVQLSMTCLTAQFAIPDDTAATIDERFFLAPAGGAVAVWGPAGVSVVHGHDRLQRGFFDRLFDDGGHVYRLGELLDAGYAELLLDAPGTEDILRTFLLLGDPLTRLRVPPSRSVFLPTASRGP